MRNPRLLFFGAVVSLAAWIQLTFRMDLQSGWTHVLLVIAVALIVMAIVAADARKDSG